MAVLDEVTTLLESLVEDNTSILKCSKSLAPDNVSSSNFPFCQVAVGLGDLKADINHTLDKVYTLNFRVVAATSEAVNTAIEELSLLFYDQAVFDQLNALGVINITPASEYPPINFKGRSANSIGDIQFDFEIRFEYP